MDTTPTTTTPKQHRHGRLFVALGLVAVLVGAAGVAWAAGVGPAIGQHFGHGGHGKDFIEFRIHRALKQVNATQAQEDQILAIADTLFERHKAMAPARQELHQRIAAALTGDTVDRAALEAIRVDAMSKAEDGSKALAKAIGDMAEVLTPAQRRQLAELHQKHFE
jgi:periplasmic protein CpxP/Spy